MKRKMSLRALIGAAVSAATLLALAPMGAANADNSSLDMSQAAAKSTITINVDATNSSSGTMEGHKFAAVKVGNYENAEGDASTHVLSSVAVSTVSGIKTDAESALSSTKTALGQSTDVAAGYEGNPIGEVASKWLGYTGTDSTSNDGTVPNGWKGNLRTFVTKLSDISTFQANFTSSSPSVTVTTGNSAQITDLTPGVYVVEDVTASGASGLSSTSHKNSIPMLVSTGVVMGSDTYSKLNSEDLGVVNLKNDAPKVTKSLDTDGVTNDPSVGGTLHYKLSTKVPLTTGFSKYVFTMIDTPSQKGLSYDAVQSVKVGGTDLDTGKYAVKNANYDGSTSTQYLVIDLSQSILDQTYGDSIVVKFTMKVNDEATGGALENGVTLGYSSDPGNQPTVVPPTINDGKVDNCPVASGTCTNGTVINDKTDGSNNNDSKAYFRHFDVLKEKKVDGSGLTGAKFTVTKQGESTAIKFLQVGNGSYKKAAEQSNTSATDKLSVYDSASSVPADTATGAPSSNGQLKIDGLADGVYTLAEDTAPAGYSDTFKPSVEVTVGKGSSDAVSGFANKGDTWGLVKTNGAYTSGAATTLNDVSWSTTGASAAPSAGAIVVQNVNSVSQLPLTGGAGAILALLVVVVLAILTASLIFVRRRLGSDSNVNNGVAIQA
ncbi:isopeptide-forming domain-containing fimbrial protein [Bifidobacterium sp. ESL0732]|uniref:isopeptide-forming domain-containing fimbrial protein n=1 Tax=Bifidobacterium sp. ESL0732 TaxID=2983222 RepID=UPI0023F6B3C8|nr:isopeptide-forming domain-containing fimbrial protein [Bifidobacterium sp. ESL0732]WEV63955.1 isopeptide-forming domain-containing fimbrial protein [Bifidobacterium sp. ESL0732]